MQSRLSYKLLAFSPVILSAVLGGACSGNGNKPGVTVNEGDTVLSERAARDEAFRSGRDSPIPEKDRSVFRGLEYYPLNEGLRFSVRLNRYPRPEQVRLATNTGEVRSGLRYGYFEFAVEGQTCRLQVYRMDDSAGGGGPSLFIPFRDATSGSETYGSGRYMDLAENTSGNYELDFNRAYNPYCAYNSEYSCPIPPAENTLPVPIRAGEKNYSH
jgi:uncharacterized protein (DUF1684 family)